MNDPTPGPGKVQSPAWPRLNLVPGGFTTHQSPPVEHSLRKQLRGTRGLASH